MEVESTWLSKSVNAGRGWWQEEIAVKEKDELNMTPAFLAWVAKKTKMKKQWVALDGIVNRNREGGKAILRDWVSYLNTVQISLPFLS